MAKSATERSTLRVRVVCTDLPGASFHDGQDAARPTREPVFLGIQRGREVIEAVRADASSVTFTPEFTVEKAAGGRANFLGPFAQGTPADRFFYLSWGVVRGNGPFEMFRRLKVRLGHLRWADVENAVRANRPIAVHLQLTDRKGGPLCATPPPEHISWTTA